jgi:hypothetical protein
MACKPIQQENKRKENDMQFYAIMSENVSPKMQYIRRSEQIS